MMLHRTAPIRPVRAALLSLGWVCEARAFVVLGVVAAFAFEAAVFVKGGSVLATLLGILSAGLAIYFVTRPKPTTDDPDDLAL